MADTGLLVILPDGEEIRIEDATMKQVAQAVSIIRIKEVSA